MNINAAEAEAGASSPNECRTFGRMLMYMGWNIFTALHGMQTRSSDENSVCPSVRLSNAALWQNGRKICPDFYTIRKII